MVILFIRVFDYKVCQLCLNNTGKKRKKIRHLIELNFLAVPVNKLL